MSSISTSLQMSVVRLNLIRSDKTSACNSSEIWPLIDCNLQPWRTVFAVHLMV